MTKLHKLASLCLVIVVGILGTGSVTAAAPKATAFNFTVSGSQVVPGPGDPDGTADANVSLHFSKPYTVCAATNPQTCSDHSRHSSCTELRPEGPALSS